MPVDIDGSYLVHKHQKLQQEAGNQLMTEILKRLQENAKTDIRYLYQCTYNAYLTYQHAGILYSYLAEGVGRSGGEGVFRALARGYVHWASGRMKKLEINIQNPSFCHVQCTMKPSMKSGTCKVYVPLERDGTFGQVKSATCECAAG